jgi:hypothetical protein
MNLFTDIRTRVVEALTAMAAEGVIPAGLDLAAVTVEPPRDPDFIYLLGDIEARTENWNRKIVSLNLEARRAEQDQAEAARLARVNEHRAALGMEPLATIDELDDSVSTAEILLEQAARTVAEMAALEAGPRQTRAVVSALDSEG